MVKCLRCLFRRVLTRSAPVMYEMDPSYSAVRLPRGQRRADFLQQLDAVKLASNATQNSGFEK